MSKRCYRCKQTLPKSAFFPAKDRKDGLTSACKWCNQLQKYGLSRNDYEAMFTQQRGKCAICKTGTVNRLHVDHDHTTGVIRGLLCFECNIGLGKFKDSARLLRRAGEYVGAY